MNPSGGYDFEAIGDMGKDFECPICLLLIRKAVELPCTHVFCTSCLEHWQANPMERNAELLCPSCKTVYQNNQVNGNKYLDKLIKTSLQVKCKESKLGCQWKRTILDYTDHAVKCSYKSINCKFVGCEERILRINQQKHQSECPHRGVHCRHCKSELPFVNLETHYGTCTEYIVNCPNEGCSVAKRRKQMIDHTQYECAYEVLDCKYKSFGCKHKFERRYTSEHEHEALPEHMNMLLNGVKVTSMELCEVKETLKTTEENLAATNEKLEKTNAILEKTRKELNQTRDDLVNANEKILQSNKVMKDVKLPDHEIDKFCFQVAKVLHAPNRSFFSTEEALKNLTEVESGLVSQKALDFDTKYGEILYAPDQWKEFAKILDATIKLPELYPDRIKQVMDTMETNKLYKTCDRDIFVKVDVTDSKDKKLYSSYHPSECTGLKYNPGTLFYSKEFLLYANDSYMQLHFCSPMWNGSSVKCFLLNPMENSSVQLPIDNILNKMKLNNMVLIKSVIQ